MKCCKIKIKIDLINTIKVNTSCLIGLHGIRISSFFLHENSHKIKQRMKMKMRFVPRDKIKGGKNSETDNSSQF